jgi:hypothetical protein
MEHHANRSVLLLAIPGRVYPKMVRLGALTHFLGRRAAWLFVTTDNLANGKLIQQKRE